MGWLYFVRRAKSRDDAERLALHALAASGDGKKIQEQIKKLLKD